MEARQINLPLDTARRWYEQGGELKEMALGAYTKQELAGDRLPKTWDEYCDQLEKSESVKVKVNMQLLRESLRLMMGYTDADKHVAMVKLRILRDKYRRGWMPDWSDIGVKYNILNNSRGYIIVNIAATNCFLSFKTNELAEEFLGNFRELIEEAGDLI